MSGLGESVGDVIFTCSKCGEPIINHYGRLASVVIESHKKFCTPKKKTPAQRVAEKRAQLAEENEDHARPLASQTYMGRMFLAGLERTNTLIRQALEKAAEDRSQIDAMISEGGRP